MPGSVFLRGPNVTLNTVSEADYAVIERLHNAPGNRHQAGISLPLSEFDVAEFVEEREDMAVFLVCESDEPVGAVLLSDIDTQADTAELGYLIDPEHQDRGYATEAVGLCIDHAFDDRGLEKVWAQVADGNDASIRVLEKQGFEQEGLLRNHEYANGERVDMYVYGLLASERAE